MAGSIERVVVYRLGSLGDTVVALPCLHAIAKAFPDAERVMLTNVPVNSKAAPLEAILGGSGLMHRFVAYPVGLRSFSALRALRASLRALEATTLIYLTPPRGLRSAWRDVLFFRLCGFTRIIGAPTTRALQENRREADGTVERECRRLARCMASLAPLARVDVNDRAAWDLQLTPAEKAAAAERLAPIEGRPRIAVNMGGKVAANDWGEDNWSALVTRLGRTNADHALMFVGAVEDEARAARVGALWPGPVINLCGQVSPRVSAAAMTGAVAFVGHDSGPMHLAGSRNVPCVGLFGNHNEPNKWHPFGPGHRAIHDMRGVRAITVDAVHEALDGLLSKASPADRGSEAHR